MDSDRRPGPTDHAVSPTGEAMTRSEERLTIGSATVPWTRAVLRIETVTEEVTVPVRITRQRARVEYQPLAAAGDAAADKDTTDREGQTTEWVTLWGEQPVVSLERTPLERVRLATEWVTDQQQVQAQLAHEEVTVETTGDVPSPGGRGRHHDPTPEPGGRPVGDQPA